jgi:hypothetical protein
MNDAIADCLSEVATTALQHLSLMYAAQSLGALRQIVSERIVRGPTLG